MAFTRRLLEIAIKLAAASGTNQPTSFTGGGIGTDAVATARPPTPSTGTFAGTGQDTVTLSGHRMSARIQDSGAPGGSTAQISVFGVSPTLMNQLATLGMVFNIIPRNTLTIAAGDADMGLATVFSGTVQQAYGEYSSAPNVPFMFECNSGLSDLVAPTVASSFGGSTDVATIMSGFARQMNRGFENNGVSVTLSNPYYAGNIMEQVRQCALDANINAELVDGNKLAIWPKGGNRNTPSVPLISKATGMIGYPAYTQQGIIVRTVFNPQVAFGGLVRVQSELKPVSDVGQWAVYKLDHALDSNMPGGHWMSTLYCYNPKYPRVIPQAATPR